MNGKLDRRSQRTRHLVGDAFVQLLNPSCDLGKRLTKIHEIHYSWGIPTNNWRISWIPKL
jgi:hypothetical protein